MNPTDRATRHWQALYDRHHALLRGAVGTLQARPDPLPAADLARLAWALLDPRSRALLRDVLLDLLAEPVAEIAAAAAEEVRRGRP